MVNRSLGIRRTLTTVTIVLPLLLLLLAGCDSKVGTLQLQITRSWDPQQEPLDQVASQVRLRIDGPDLLVGPESFDLAERRGTLDKVTVGEDRIITVEGLGPERDTVSRGRTGSLSIVEGDNVLSLYVGLKGKQGEFSFSTNHLQQARAFHTATLLDRGTVLLSGGTVEDWRPEGTSPPAAFLASIDLLEGNALTFRLDNPTCNEADREGCLVSARIGHTAVLLPSGNVLLAGGMNSQGLVETVEIYNSEQGQFLKGATPLLVPRVGHAAALVGDAVFLVGGANTSMRATAGAESYNHGTLTAIPSLLQARRCLSLTALPDGTLVAAGGFDQQELPLKSTELLRPGAASWVSGPDLHVARAYHTATLLEDGHILFVGGVGENDTATRSIERLDPQTEELILLEDQLSLARWAHTTTRLQDQRILVVGGFGADTHGAAMSSVEAIQLFAEDWRRSHVRALANLRQPRAGHTATLLQNGFLLVAGGVGNSKALNTAEVFVY